ncbi:MAG TPA: DUF1700 domain-containing protein [Steroidobacteraceae bacterium]|jgi:uncharacterized membrane protein|nr:DUF1700 domain-containing protein [Steroidobacteraceae bacterium]
MSARAEFLATLRAGLRGVPSQAVDEAVTDYSAHFEEGATAGRSDADIAAALGDPLALADELRVELHIERWQATPSARSALQIIAGSLALGTMNTFLVFVALPLMLVFALATLFSIAICVIAGIWFAFAGGSLGLPGGPAVVPLCALGLVSAAISFTALGILTGKALVTALGRYVRINYRFLTRPPGPGLTT